MFTGAHRVRVDDKGRLAIPAGFRKQLPEGSYVSVSQDSALAIYPPDLWDALAQELRSPLPGPDQRALARTLYSMSEAFEPDGQGRGAAPVDGNRDSVDRGGDRNGIAGRNLARGPMEQLQRRRARALHRIR